jgi:8-oxo-dGTP diphosphatase
MRKETDKRVFVALINDAGQVLVIKRSAHTNNPGQIGLPGGHMDQGETIEQTARRELLEELGIDVDFERISFIKLHADQKRTILFAKMLPSSMYVFNINEQEVECIFWMRVHELVGLHGMDDQSEEQGHQLHKSLELALPLLCDLEPKLIVQSFTMTQRGVR